MSPPPPRPPTAEQAFMQLLAELRALRLTMVELITTIRADQALRQQQQPKKGLDGFLDGILGIPPKK